MSNITFTPNANGRTDVLVDGEVVGQVFRADYHTTTVVTDGVMRYGVGRAVTRSNRWAWQMADGTGNDDFASRKAAVEDMLCFI